VGGEGGGERGKKGGVSNVVGGALEEERRDGDGKYRRTVVVIFSALPMTVVIPMETSESARRESVCQCLLCE